MSRPGRKGGMASKLREKERREKLAEMGAQINAASTEQMREQMKVFQTHLESFAKNHKNEIQRDPVFRAKFHSMCASIGVDPLTSKKGVWADLLGVGDYYYELAVRIVEVCVASRPINGGIMSFKELMRALRAKRVTYTENISEDDVERAIGKLDVLGGGFQVFTTGKEKVVRSVPLELTIDHTKVLEICSKKGHTSRSEVQSSLGWTAQRANGALNFLLEKEIAWIDKQTREPTYWVLGLVDGSSAQT